MEVDQQHLPWELWLYVFRFLDMDTLLLRLPYVCKGLSGFFFFLLSYFLVLLLFYFVYMLDLEFNELTCSNSIWEPIVRFKFPSATVNLRNKADSFKTFFKHIYELSVIFFKISILFHLWLRFFLRV
jgi:hypothetical protein